MRGHSRVSFFGQLNLNVKDIGSTLEITTIVDNKESNV